jgi:hypothetical protein
VIRSALKTQAVEQDIAQAIFRHVRRVPKMHTVRGRKLLVSTSPNPPSRDPWIAFVRSISPIAPR